jgi:hypothetical protein
MRHQKESHTCSLVILQTQHTKQVRSSDEECRRHLPPTSAGCRPDQSGGLVANSKNQVTPSYRIIRQLCNLRQTLTINFRGKNEIFYIKIIPLESSFKYESNDMIFI